MRFIAFRILINVATTGMLAVGCSRPKPTTAAAPIPWPHDHYCWWSAFRTTLPPDSVSTRFARALTAMGLEPPRTGSRADTTWAEAGPTTSADYATPDLYAARIVAFRHGDSTRFRAFVATPAIDSGGAVIQFCAELLRTAKLAGLAPRAQEPDDTLSLWRRRP
jgi:hypothetical protein